MGGPLKKEARQACGLVMGGFDPALPTCQPGFLSWLEPEESASATVDLALGEWVMAKVVAVVVVVPTG